MQQGRIQLAENVQAAKEAEAAAAREAEASQRAQEAAAAEAEAMRRTEEEREKAVLKIQAMQMKQGHAQGLAKAVFKACATRSKFPTCMSRGVAWKSTRVPPT